MKINLNKTLGHCIGSMLIIFCVIATFIFFMYGLKEMIRAFHITGSVDTFFAIFASLLLAPVVLFLAPLYSIFAWGNWWPLFYFWLFPSLLLMIGGVGVQLIESSAKSKDNGIARINAAIQVAQDSEEITD